MPPDLHSPFFSCASDGSLLSFKLSWHTTMISSSLLGQLHQLPYLYYVLTTTPALERQIYEYGDEM